MRLFCCGGAPLDKTINEFFWIIGMPILEGLRSDRDQPGGQLNNLDEVRFGSVGTPFEQTEIKIADDGELLIRGPQVMSGYYKDPAATRETIAGRLVQDRRYRPHRETASSISPTARRS